MASWKEQLNPVTTLRSQRAGLDQQVYADSLQLQQLQARLTTAKEKNTGEEQELLALISETQASREKNLGLFSATEKKLAAAVSSLYGSAGPQERVEQWDDNLPVSLFPVRVETRFQTTGQTTELWVRIYPDDIAIHTFEKTLSGDEVSAGERYWKKLFSAMKSGGAGAEDSKKAAWSALVTAYGSGRSAWVARQTKPVNWSSDGSSPADEDGLIFPPFDLVKTDGWSRAPRATLLPDHFVVTLYNGTTKAHEVVGSPIPEELLLGPDPHDADGSFNSDGTMLTFGAGFDWTSNFDKAVANGMGMRIVLSPEESKNGFDRLLVLGLCLSRPPGEGVERLQDLIDNHHYSNAGFALLPQGSPTNNTTGVSSAFSSKDPFDGISYFTETGKPMFLPTDDCDARNLADALGISYETLQYVGNADARDNRDAMLLNQALYPGTLGYYTEVLLSPVLDDHARSLLREFFLSFVTGRGPLPAIRAGNQPYGMLLTSDFTRWQWQKQEPGFPSGFLNKLYAVLKDYRQIWTDLTPNLLFAGKSGADPSAVLLNILGLQPGSVNFYQRNAYSTDDLYNRDGFEYGQRYFADVQKNFSSKNDGLNWLASLGFPLTANAGAPSVPQILRLVYQHYTSTLDPLNVTDNIPLSETTPVHNYDNTTNKNYLDWLASAATVNELEQQSFGPGVTVPNQLMYLMLRKALLLTLHGGSVKWTGARGVVFSDTISAANFHNIRPDGTLTKWELMKAPLSVAEPEHPMATTAVADYLLGPGKDENEAGDTTAIRNALSELAGRPSAALERCFTEHIDTLSYRLDSWETGLFTYRLRSMREAGKQTATGAAQVSTGLLTGAYGWVENLRPAARVAVASESVPEPLRPKDEKPVYFDALNGGYVHTPSLNHAKTAAVLRSGYLSRADAGSPDALSVNLSSERVRRAKAILDGIANNQTLEALLGYQFERGLHDRASADNTLLKLNEYIYDFRDAFPVARTLIQQQGTTTQEAIPANNVVNGLTLSQSAAPFPYGATGSVTAAAPGEQAAILAEKDRLADTLDAIKDMLTMESVHQLVMGNYDRAGAVMNALQNGTAPPVMDSIVTPRGTQFRFTNRVTIHFEHLEPGDAATNPWPAVSMTPRAKAEPGLNRWLASIIGLPENLAVTITQTDSAGNAIRQSVHTIDQLQLQPIDLIFLVQAGGNTGQPVAGKENRTGTSEMEMRLGDIFRSLHSLPDDALITIGFLDAGVSGRTPLGKKLPLFVTLQSMITDARYAHAQDFNPGETTPENEVNPKGLDTAELTARINTVLAASAGQDAVLRSISVSANIKGSDGITKTYTDLGSIFDALDLLNLGFSEIDFTLTGARASEVRDQLKIISTGGINNAYPVLRVAATPAAQISLLEQARNAGRDLAAALSGARALVTKAGSATTPQQKVDALISAGKNLLGAAFPVLPLFALTNESDVLHSHAEEEWLLAWAKGSGAMVYPAEEWLQQAALVRPRLARWDLIRTFCESDGIDLPVHPVQLPFRTKDSWLAVGIPDMDPLRPTEPFVVTRDTYSVTAHGISLFIPGTPHCGMVVDDWTEAIPNREEITGIAFNYDRPNALPPQAILLAVPPQIKGHWDWESLQGILNDTLLRSKLRAVEPQMLAGAGKVQTSVMLPAVLSNYSQYDLDLTLDYRMNIREVAELLPTQVATANAFPHP